MAASNKLVKTTLSDQLCAELKTMISEGEFPVGSRLPSENELAEEFGVSRLTVRIALQKLNSQGLTVTRPGDGTFVKEFSMMEYLDQIPDLSIKPEIMDDVLEFRSFVEEKATHLAIERAKDEDFEQLTEITNRMLAYQYDREHPERFDIDGYVELDFMFHATVCELSGNSLIYLAYMMAKNPIKEYIKNVVNIRTQKYFEKYPDKRQVAVDAIMTSTSHADILKCIRTRDHEAYSQLFQSVTNYKASIF